MNEANSSSFSISSFSLILFLFSSPFPLGPNFWGLLNPEWGLCTKGRRQSPINIVPEQLLFDSNLRSINIDRHRVSTSRLVNIHTETDSYENLSIRTYQRPINEPDLLEQIESDFIAKSVLSLCALFVNFGMIDPGLLINYNPLNWVTLAAPVVSGSKQ